MADSPQPLPIFHRHAFLRTQSNTRMEVVLTPDLRLQVKSSLGALIVQSEAGSIEVPDAAGPLPCEAERELLESAVTLFRRSVEPTGKHFPPLFFRRLQAHDSGFKKAYLVHLDSALRLWVTDRRTGWEYASSRPGKLDQLDNVVRLDPYKRRHQ